MLRNYYKDLLNKKKYIKLKKILQVWEKVKSCIRKFNLITEFIYKIKVNQLFYMRNENIKFLKE